MTDNKKKYILVIDIGTGSSRSLLFNTVILP
jgi:sugar (pentulose or hexulose) kinase